MINFAGDTEIYSNSIPERLYAVLTLLFAFLASASVVSSITSSMTRLSIATAHDANMIMTLKRYLTDNDISARVALRVQRNASHALEERRRHTPEQDIELLQLVSEPLRVELHFEINQPVLEAHAFFHNYCDVAPGLMRQACHQSISRMQLSRGDVLFSAGEVPKVPRMYFLYAGKLKYDRTAESHRTVHKGEWACEAVLWTQWMHYGLMRTKTECTLVVLEALIFQNICQQYTSQMDYARSYGKAFVQHINGAEEVELTDLEDPEMDVDWLAWRAHPNKKTEKRRQSSKNPVTGLWKGSMALLTRSSSKVQDDDASGARGNLLFKTTSGTASGLNESNSESSSSSDSEACESPRCHLRHPPAQ